jgi:hypothetical protein
MIREIRGYRLLQGYRGHPTGDIPAIEEVLASVSRVVEDIPEIQELDLNPIFGLSTAPGVCRCGCPDPRENLVNPLSTSARRVNARSTKHSCSLFTFRNREPCEATTCHLPSRFTQTFVKW